MLVKLRADPKLLDDLRLISKLLERAAILSGMKLVKKIHFKFSPQGLSVVLLLKQSHMAYHSWPEKGSAYLELTTCGESTSPESALNLIANELKAEVKLINQNSVEV